MQGWNPNHKAWAIYYNEKAGKDADRKIKEVRLPLKDKFGAALAMEKFLAGKYGAYQKALAEWNEISQSSKKRLVIDAEE